MTTGEIIQNKRKQLGWSQDQLAEKLDISRQSISKWEQDLALPDLENGSKLCEALGITVEELLYPTHIKSEKQVNSENSFQSAEKFIKKRWHFSGLYFAFVGLSFSVAGFIFKLISQAMSKQFQNNVDGMFGGIPGLFPSLDTTSFLTPFLNFFIGAGVIIMLIGLGIFAYGQFQKQRAY
jgi:transcriptional regulator with XRE-family HTH domain